jgi:intracellular sulfur oxidation DsrE/DsrF family protein
MTYPNTTYPNTPRHIDIPVKLDDVKAVFSVASLSFEGDMPASLFHLGLITDDIADWGATSEVVVVFHTNAGHVTLDDAAYNADRGIKTGNPYRELVTNLMSRGVHVELCGATAKVHHYGNGDLLPGIKINTDAMARTTELVQQGFVKITED